MATKMLPTNPRKFFNDLLAVLNINRAVKSIVVKAGVNEVAVITVEYLPNEDDAKVLAGAAAEAGRNGLMGMAGAAPSGMDYKTFDDVRHPIDR